MRRIRLFGALMRLFPLDFRIEHGREIEQVFHAQRQHARREGTLGALARLWFETVWDLLRTAPRQHASMLRQDLAYALRTLRRTPGFTAAAVLTLAIGISGSATTFTIINAFFFRPLPVDRPGELVSISTLGDGHVEIPHGLSYPDVRDYSEMTDVFAGLLAYGPGGGWLDTGNGLDRIVVEAVTENAFALLGVRPSAGRVLAPSDEGSPVIVLSHEYWRGRFGSSPSVVGRTVRLNEQLFTIVGVADERFTGLESLLRVSAFVPLSTLHRVMPSIGGADWIGLRDRHWLGVVGRLHRGVILERARAALAVKTSVLARQYPATNSGVSLLVVPEPHARPLPQNGPVFHMAAVALSLLAGLLLLLTSANIANMLLARAASRGREMALRAALGARQGRILRQLFTESVVLAMSGGGGAMLLAMLAAAAMERAVANLNFDVPLRVDFGLDWRVLMVTVAVAAAAGLIAGLAPALYTWRTDVNSLLKTGGRRDGSERGRLRNLLVVAQVAVSLVLLVVGGLFLKTLESARRADLGFRQDHILLTKVDLPQSYATARRTAYFRDVVNRVAALPGVRRAAWISALPFGFEMGDTSVQPKGEPTAPPGREPWTLTVSVTPEYFQTAGLGLVSGRPFDARDGADSPPVAIVNEKLAQELWPDRDPVGRRMQLLPGGPEVEIVGVVKTGKYILLWEAPRPMMFQPLAQALPFAATLEVLTVGSPGDLANAVRQALHGVDGEVPVSRLQTMSDYLENGQAFVLFRIGGLITGLFGVLGLFVASIGLYGVVAYDITQRTHEIGVRMALGALRADVLRDVLSRGARLALPGAVLGALMAAAVAWTLRTLLIGVSPFDPLTYGGTALLLLAVCLAASFVPARRAATANPIDALRGD
jgi:predicted permease